MRELSRERSKKMIGGSHEEIIQALSKARQMQVSRGIETAIEEGIEEMVVDKYKYQGGVEEQSIKCKNISSIYPPAVEKLSRRQELSQSIHQVSRSCRESDKKKLKKLDRQQGIEKVSRRCRAAYKTSFSRCEKHRHECNPTCNSTNDPINILSS